MAEHCTRIPISSPISVTFSSDGGDVMEHSSHCAYIENHQRRYEGNSHQLYQLLQYIYNFGAHYNSLLRWDPDGGVWAEDTSHIAML